MKARTIAQVTDTIPGNIFSTPDTEILVSRFEAAERSKYQEDKLSQMERIRDDAYKIAFSVWRWNPLYLSNKNFQSAYAIHCGAKKAANSIVSNCPELGEKAQQLDISLGFRFWKAARRAHEDARLRGQTIEWLEKPGTKVISSFIALDFFTKAFSFTGDRKSIESLREDWPVLRKGSLASSAFAESSRTLTMDFLSLISERCVASRNDLARSL